MPTVMRAAEPSSDGVVSIDFDDPSFRRDPYPFFHRLRREDPVHFRAAHGDWLLTRYRDVATVLREPRFGTNPRSTAAGDWRRMLHLRGSEKLAQLWRASEQLVALWMTALDDPDHTRLRRLVAPAFTAERIEALGPVADAVTERLLDGVSATPAVELIGGLAFPLPVAIITEILGMPADRRFEAWARDIAQLLDLPATRSAVTRGLLAVAGFAEYVRDIVDAGRASPDGLLAVLVAARGRGDLDEDELWATVTLLLFAGHETTRHLIGTGVLALLRHPEQLERLRAHPHLIHTAVEELLRYDSPGQVLWRVAREDVEMGGKRICTGQFVRALIGAANRDPEQFLDPDRLDIGRRPNPHLAFGAGMHHCLGAALARVEVSAAILGVLRRWPRLRLAGEPEWESTVRLRGLRTLPLLV